MTRASKVSIGFATANKRRQVAALLEAYRAAVNFYVRDIWENGGSLDKDTLSRLTATRLSARFKSQALKQAIEVVVGTKRAARTLKITPSCPVFRGSAVLDSKFVNVETGKGSFDLVIRLSTLHKGHRITVPTKKTAHLNKLLAWPGAALIQGCALSERGIILWVRTLAADLRNEGRVLGIDLGMNKLVSDSDGNHYGTEFRAVRDKIRARKPKSKGRQRAFHERENLINRTLNLLPWKDLQALGVELLHDMKRGKQRNRGKSFRKAIAPWVYRRVLTRAEHKAEENRVLFVSVSPAYTSQTCPACGWREKDNRRGEKFQCKRCGRAADADTVGALNVLARTLATLGSVESPRLIKAVG